jgi:glycine oxidase
MRNVDELPESADAIVVGGGVIGLSVARELGRRGARVVLIERGEQVGAESSWAAAGMLAPQVEADGADAFFAFAAASRDAYPNFARELEAESGINIELDLTGTLYLAFTETDEEECERRFRWQTRAGLEVERLTASEVRALEPQVSARVRSALRFPRDGQVENRLLTLALVKAGEARGVRVITETEVASITEDDGGVAMSVETSRGAIRAHSVVVACGAWSSLIPRARNQVSFDQRAERRAEQRGFKPVDQVGSDATCPRIEPVRGQMLCFAPRLLSPLVRHVVYSPRGYIVPRRDGRLLAGTTTEHAGFDKSLTDAGRHTIMSYAREIAPAVDELNLSDAWAGLRPRAADEWPVIGAYSAEMPNLFYATGHYRNGILLAPQTGALVAEMIMERAGGTPDMLKPFTPERFRRAVAGAV